MREKEGGLSSLQCLNDKIGGNLGMEASRFLLEPCQEEDFWCQQCGFGRAGCDLRSGIMGKSG